ncbi:MAG: 30S ribosomal protein S6 [Candidatus Sungiibacteriota bacterium]|uniref:Small ribosomal subunit protein bS6 n=1 Tax=Candidatus Sungiibacteriota bacterium TaxID=2750080 RepID=A0A7T5RJN6_9BACT|nr:MAG: 30S ribosomal protein S6 [Candidatus Sungbacteria bacterium]
MEKNYELAYLFSSTIPEEDILTWTEKLSTIIGEAKGLVKNVETPKKRLLAYVVKKEKHAYFGWTTLTIAPEFLKTLDKKIRGMDKLLRYLVVEEVKAEVRHQTLRIVPPRPAAKHPRVIPREMPKTDEKLDLEALDKKLEEILGK